MADSPKPDFSRFLNPWLLQLQKLALELKCHLCLNLLTRPKLLPCNHIFCSSCIPGSTQFGSECSICKLPFSDLDLREAPYMENIVNIYRSLERSCSAHLNQFVSSDPGKTSMRCPGSEAMDCDSESIKGHVHKSEEGGSTDRQCTFSFTANKRVQASSFYSSENGFVKKKDFGNDAVPKENEFPEDINAVPQSLPCSPLSYGDDVRILDDDSGDQGSARGPGKMYSASSLDERPDCQAIKKGLMPCSSLEEDCLRDVKRQKKMNFELPDMGTTTSAGSHPVDVPCGVSAASTENMEFASRGPQTVGQPDVSLDSSNKKNYVCAFCQSSRVYEATGPMLHYAKGEPVEGIQADKDNVIHVHTKCIDWAPQVYYAGETVKNLEKELSRSAKLKCCCCGLKGAALGCYAKSCRKSYHVPCAVEVIDCRWDMDNFLVLCPTHSSIRFPNEKSKASKRASRNNSGSTKIEESKFWSSSSNEAKGWVLCGSALSSDDKFLLVKFAQMIDVTVTKSWNPNVTHVIAATDADGACTRTLKVLMAIVNGRWILTIDWIKACMQAMRPMDEEPYEVSLDNHGCHDGPKTGRLSMLNKEPKLFNGLSFYFTGEFLAPYKRDLQTLIIAAGGTIIKEMLTCNSHNTEATRLRTLAVYNLDPPQGSELGEEVSIVLKRLDEAVKVASEFGCQVVPHTWVLGSVAAAKLQPFST